MEKQMTRTLSTQPLYLQLRDVLVARISSGSWKPGHALPNEIDLSREYSLSAGTVRKALDWMEDAKLVSRQQGRGTFVRDPSSEEFVNWYERLRKADGTPVADHIADANVTEVEADAYACARLQLPPGAQVRRSKRTRTLDGLPYIVETSVVPCALFPMHGTKDHSLLELAKLCGVLLGKGEERISAESASGKVAATLRCAVGEPVLRLDRLVWTIDAKPAEWRVGVCKMVGNYYAASIGPNN
jgi:GntR family transcriptional regulator